ncbi:MAG: VOC family protein, partial [Selenomonadaceae bacterium]|nr:VOC family protein [Selenomonadaceae bacterium]
MFKVLGVDHIGIAAGDLKEVGSFWSDALGLATTGEETVEEQKVTTGFYPTPNGSEIELLVATAPDSPIAKYIEKKGEGIQHIALRVDNLEEALSDLKAKGVRLIDEKPRKGAGGAKI